MKKVLTICLLITSIIISGCTKKQSINYEGISFEYPDYLTMTYHGFDAFHGANIDIEVSSIPVFMNHCAEMLIERNSDLFNWYDLYDKYTSILEDIRDNKLNDEVSGFESVSCGFGMGNSSYESVNIDGANGIIFNKLSGDSGLPDMKGFFKQLLLVTNENQVYNIVFNYDFGELGEYLGSLEDEFGHKGYLDEDEEYKWEDVNDYFTNGDPIDDINMKMFEDNEAIINEIISTITL